MKHHSITLNHLRTFCVVAKLGSFNQAADELSRTQPAITLAVKQLEDYIGISLLERTTRSVSLTKEGQNFLPIVNELILDFDLAMSDMTAVADCRYGHVSIAVVASIASKVMPEIIRRFSSNHPDVSIHVYDDNSKGVQSRVETNEVDFGIASLWHANKKLSFHPFLEDTYKVVCHRDHEIAVHNRSVTWDKLSKYSFMGSGLTQSLKMQSAIGNPKFEFSNTTTLIAMLKSNVGITVLPSLAVPNDPIIKSFALTKPLETRDIGIITRKNTTLSPAAKEMIKTLAEFTPQIIKDNSLNTKIIYPSEGFSLSKN